MKKHLSYFLSTALLFMLLFASGVEVLAATKTVIIDGIKYKYSKNKDYLIVVSAAYSGDVVIPDTAGGLPVKEVGSSAFSELDDLKSVTLPNTVVKIGDYAFDSSTNLENVSLGDSVKTIGHWTFRNCYNLNPINFPESLETIGNYCFDKNLKLTEVTIPAKVTLIGGYAFEGNPQLTKVYSLSTTPPEIKKGYIDGNEIYTLFDDNDYGDRTLYVPKGTKESYKLTFGWNQFKNVEEIETTSIKTTKDGNTTLTAFSPSKGTLSVYAEVNSNITVFNAYGQIILKDKVNAGTTSFTGMPSGLVIISGKKIVIR